MLSATAVGLLGRDAETRQAGSSQVCNFSIATEFGFGDKKVTTWVDVAIWGKQAEWCGNNLKKGDRVAVSGKGYLRKWDKDGKSGSAFTIEANDCEKQWPKKDGNEGGGSGGGYSGNAGNRGNTGSSGGGGAEQGGNAGGYEPDGDIPFNSDIRWSDDRIVR